MAAKSEQCANHEKLFEDVVLATRDLQNLKDTLTITAARSQADHDMLITLNAKVAAWALLGSVLGGALIQLLSKYL